MKPRAQRPNCSPIGDRRIHRTFDFIHAHLDHDLDICTIAQAADTSPFHLARIFRSALGCSIWQYVSRRRIQLATGLMKDPALPLSEVASMSGFDSYSTFAATFKSTQGISPTRFRASLDLHP